MSNFLSTILISYSMQKRTAELNSLFLLQIKELEAAGVKPQEAKTDTGLGAKRKVT